jgi:K+-H+ exchange-related protein
VDAVVYLVPLGRNRYELYSEPPEEREAASPPDGAIARRVYAIKEWWRSASQNARRPGVDAAAHTEPRGLMARARDWLVSNVAETIASQRTLWALRSASSVDLRYPSNVPEPEATTLRRDLLTAAQRHHGIWLVVDGALFAASGLLVLVPGPNVLAYYFGLRVVGHYLSWRGARRGLLGCAWHSRPESALAELGSLATEPRDARATRVEAIAASLNLPRLASFFDRVAV